MLRWISTLCVIVVAGLACAGLVSAGLSGVGLDSWAAQAPRAYADAIEFDFKDPKGVNTFSFVLDSPTEPIMGVAQGISGKVKFDPAAPDATTGHISVESKSVKVPNERMTTILHNEKWLDVEKYPEIRFTLKSVKKSKKTEHGFNLLVVGELTLHGVTKEVEVPVDVRHLIGGLEKRMPGRMKGDLLVLRARFTVNRRDYKVGASMPAVAEQIEIRMAMVGMAPRK